MLYVSNQTLAYLRDYQRRLEARERVRLAQHKPEKPRRISTKKFVAAVEYVGRILDDGKPTKFQHEGACRQGLRVAFIGEGWRWADADHEAMRIVGAALQAIDAKRPSWMQGQPDYREVDTSDWRCRHCLACGGILDDAQPSRHCSRECASVTAKRTWARENVDRQSAVQKAWVAANPDKRKATLARHIERSDPRDCQHCGLTFKVENSQKDKFCSPACGYAQRKVDNAKRNEKQCYHCRSLFVARPRARKTHFCSKACFIAEKRICAPAT